MNKVTIVYNNVKLMSVFVPSQLSDSKQEDLAFEYADNTLSKQIKGYDLEKVELYFHNRPSHHELFNV